MTCTISSERIQSTIDFHGHVCPGLSIGIRAAELALRELATTGNESLVAVVETDMCGVDAIQFLTGCTFGKGNLIHHDHGKMAFSFHNRETGKGFRALLKAEARGGMDVEMAELMNLQHAGTATEEDLQRLAELREQLRDRFMTLPLEDMFDIRTKDAPAPRPAAILQSLRCEHCGESTMESRTRRFGGKTLCIPCFSQVEQKM